MNPEPDPVKVVVCVWLCLGMYRETSEPSLIYHCLQLFTGPNYLVSDQNCSVSGRGSANCYLPISVY